MKYDGKDAPRSKSPWDKQDAYKTKMWSLCGGALTLVPHAVGMKTMGIMDLFRQIETGADGRLRGKLSWIVAGLGNPGLEYEWTRHNAGFLALEQLAQQCGVTLSQMRFQSDCAEAMVGAVRCLLMKPATYMNRSGDAIAAAAQFYRIPSERVLVIYDDISLPPGRLRIRRKGSAGGHNGIKSIIDQLGTEQFPRIRVGVGAKPDPRYDLADWVLSKFTEEERTALRSALEAAAEAAKWITAGEIDRAMNQFSH